MENYAYIVTYEYAPAYSCSKVVICPTREIAEKTVAAIKDIEVRLREFTEEEMRIHAAISRLENGYPVKLVDEY